MPKRPVQIPVRPGLEHLFGRHINHNPASRAFPVRVDGPIVSATHQCRIPILNQRVGSCTGNAQLYVLGTEPFYSTLLAAKMGMVWTEDTAEEFYSVATRIDPFAGQWPPEDTGSDGNSVATVTRDDGLIAGWEHAFTHEQALAALSIRPIMVGVNWYDSMLHTSDLGEVAISRRAKIAGGHEVCLRWIDVEREQVGGPNSWGEDWGVAGEFWMSFKTFFRLLDEDGDATLETPLDMSAPQPVDPEPLPAPTPPVVDEQAFWDEVKALAAQHGLR